MRNRYTGSLIAAVLLLSLCPIPQTSADIYEADFAGTTGANAGTYPQGQFGCPVVSGVGCTFPAGTPFTATFVFDTSLGVLSSPSAGTFELTGGLVSDILAITGVGTFSNTGSDLNVLEWQANSTGGLDLIAAVARAAGGFQNITFFGTQASFQTGTCPGRPCSPLFVTSESLTDRSSAPVPGPIVGAGLPGVMFASAALLAWARRRSKATLRLIGKNNIE